MREKVDRYEKKSCGRYWPVKPEEKGLAIECRPADAGAKTAGNRKAEVCSVNKDRRLKVLAGWCRNKRCWRPQKLFSVCRAAAGCVFCRLFPPQFLPAGFVSSVFRHIVSDTNYKERGIFYG